MTYWPGTKIVKSRGNAFDWRGRQSQLTQDRDLMATNSAHKQKFGTSAATSPEPHRAFTIYSRARKSA